MSWMVVFNFEVNKVILERNMHAKGSGACGVFERYADVEEMNEHFILEKSGLQRNLRGDFQNRQKVLE